MENRQGDGKNSVGNVEAKELISITHGHELRGGNAGGLGDARQGRTKGEKWENSNSIINKIYLKKRNVDLLFHLVTCSLVDSCYMP